MGKIATRAKTICKYHIHGCQHYIKCQKNAVKFNTHNDIEHELAKAKICYDLQKMGHEFITEACRNDTGDIIDIVDLTDGSEVEIDWKHGNISELQKRGVTIYKVEKIVKSVDKDAEDFVKRLGEEAKKYKELILKEKVEKDATV